MQGIRHAERTVAVPARSLVGHAIAIAAHRSVRDAEARAVDRDKHVDRILERTAEQRADPAEIAWTFFAHRPDHQQATGERDLVGNNLPSGGQHRRQSAAVVTDAGGRELGALALHLHVGPFGEHRVQVTAQHQRRSRAGARDLADHVAFAIHAQLLNAKGGELVAERGSARGFLKRRRRDLAEGGLLGQRPLVLGLQGGHGLGDSRLLGEAIERRLGGGGLGCGLGGALGLLCVADDGHRQREHQEREQRRDRGASAAKRNGRGHDVRS